MRLVSEAQELLLQHAPPRRIENRSLAESLGLILAQDLTAAEPLPPFPRSGMDGYAVRALETAAASRERPVQLPLKGIIPAGHPLTEPLPMGASAAIMTGGAIPEGADAVIRLEEVRIQAGNVVIHRPVAAGENVAAIGEDVAIGQVILRAGHSIRPAEINLIAAVGMERIPVFAPPRVGVLCTGDELAPAGSTLAYGQIYNSNGPGIAAMVAAAGCTAVDLGTAHDATALIATALRQSAACDLILTSGGVSVGEYDVLKEALAVLGAKQLFWRVAMKPGMPMYAGLLADRLVIGLSGNPAAAITNFDLLVLPLLDMLCGRSQIGMRATKAVLDDPVLRTLPLARYLRARLYLGEDGQLHANTAMSQRAGVLSSMIQTNGYALVPAHTGPVPAGESLTVFLQREANRFPSESA